MKSTEGRKYLKAQATTHVVEETFTPTAARNKLKLKRPKAHTAQASMSQPPCARPERTSLEDFQVEPMGRSTTPANDDANEEEKVSCYVGWNLHLTYI